MVLSTYDMAVAASLLMGVTMVCSSLFLLYKGKLKLDAAAGGGADTTVEFSKYLKFSTHYPALALFLFGGAFLGYPLLYRHGFLLFPGFPKLHISLK